MGLSHHALNGGPGSGLSRRQAAWMALVGLALSLAAGWASVARWAPMVRLDHAVLDASLTWSASGRPATRSAVVDIDDASLSALGQWPWPRYRIAALIERIAAHHPAAIALDILFPEADRASLASVQQTYKRDFGIDVAFSGVPSGLLDNDGYLGDTIERHRVVAGNYFYFDQVNVGAAMAPLASRLQFDGRTDLLAPDAATGLLVNADPIASHTAQSGFINARLDDDGTLRRMPLLIRQADSVHPSLALAAVMQALGVSRGTVRAGRDGLLLQLGIHAVPLDEHGDALLRLLGAPALYPAVSAVDVLAGRVPAESLAGKVVFLGASAVGLNDHHPTAFDPHFPGLRIQAAMAEDLLLDQAVATPRWAPAAVFVGCLLMGMAMTVLFVRGSGVGSTVAGTLALAVLVSTAAAVLFLRAGWFVSVGSPMVVCASLFIIFTTARFSLERTRALSSRKRLERARQLTMESMAAVAETRDPETGAHIKRTQHYVRAVAEELRRSGHHRQILTDDYIELLYISAPLHDIGKVGVPDHILLKPGRLTFDEMETMKQHAELGRRIVSSTGQRIEGDNFLIIAGEIAGTHHEKWDGTGYPRGLKGVEIPLSGRIMAVADIYDALISKRCYKDAYSHAHATGLMRDLRDKTFDPDVLDAFFRIETEILAIAEQFRDEDEDEATGLPVEPVGPTSVPASAAQV